MAPKARSSVSRQSSTGFVFAKRSCDAGNREGSQLRELKPDPLNSQLDEVKNEPTQKLKLYNLNIEQQKIWAPFTPSHFPKETSLVKS